MKIMHVDHVGMVVNDLDAAKDFFVDLGFTVAGETSVEGEWVGRVIGLQDVRSDIVMLQAPDGQVNLELSKFHNPPAVDSQQNSSHTLGLRHIAFQVENLESVVKDLNQKGNSLVGEIENYKDTSSEFKYGGWTVPYASDESGKLMVEQMSMPFDLLLGRKTYEMWTGYWPKNEDGPIGAKFKQVKKNMWYQVIQT